MASLVRQTFNATGQQMLVIAEKTVLVPATEDWLENKEIATQVRYLFGLKYMRNFSAKLLLSYLVNDKNLR